MGDDYFRPIYKELWGKNAFFSGPPYIRHINPSQWHYKEKQWRNKSRKSQLRLLCKKVMHPHFPCLFKPTSKVLAIPHLMLPTHLEEMGRDQVPGWYYRGSLVQSVVKCWPGLYFYFPKDPFNQILLLLLYLPIPRINRDFLGKDNGGIKKDLGWSRPIPFGNFCYINWIK